MNYLYARLDPPFPGGYAQYRKVALVAVVTTRPVAISGVGGLLG